MSNWQIKKLGEVCNIIMGQSPPSDTYNENAKGIPFFQGKAEFTDLYPIVKKYCSKPTKLAEPFDILLSVRAPVGTTNIANQQCCIGRGLAAIRFKNYKYGFYFLRSIQHELDSKGTGTTFRAISGETIRETLIPYPSLETQHAIVSKIEELFSELDQGIADLKTAQAQLKVYRQSVLKHAFEGKLTNKNVKEGELPEGWEVLKIKDVCEIKGGKNQSKVINPNGKYPIYGSSGIFGYADEYICDENTTIIGRKGNINSPLYVTTKFWNVDTAFGLCANEKYNNKLLFYFCKGFNFKKLDKSTTIPSLAKSDILSIDIQIPPIEEQHLIVQEIESRLSVADKMEESIQESLQKAEALRQSILKKAFSGELV